MKCPACNKENRGHAGFCAFCGAKLPEAPHGARPAAQGEDSDNPWSDAPRAQDDQAPQAPRPRAARPTVKLVPRPTVKLGPPPEEIPAEETPPREGPLQPGDLLGGRYRIVDVVEGSPDHTIYRALDLKRCPNCGSEENGPEVEFCANCGSSLAEHPYVTLTEQVRRPPEHFERQFTLGERDYYVTSEPLPELVAPEETGPQAMHLQWGRATDQGRQRDHNEDYLEGGIYAMKSGGVVALFVVADGLGGQDSGEVASQMTTEALWQALTPTVIDPAVRGEPLDPEATEAALREAIRAANQAVYDARIARHSQMSSTLTMALVIGEQAYIGNVGDSRTYIYGANGLERITKDHSLVQRLVDTKQIRPQDVYTHPQRNLIYQSIGDRPDPQIDLFQRTLQLDDRLLLCSDGLWEMVREEGILEVLQSEPDPQRACDRLLRNANLAGGEDNISVIIARMAPATA